MTAKNLGDSGDFPRAYTLRFIQRFYEKSSPEQLDNYSGVRAPSSKSPFGFPSGSPSCAPRVNTPLKSSGYFSPKREYVPVVRSENAWIGHKLGMSFSESEILLNKIRSDLNKLSPDNEDTIITRICESVSADNLECIVSIIFEKVAREVKFHVSYANLCSKIYSTFPLITQSINTKYEECHDLKVSDDDEDDEIALAVKNRAGIIGFTKELLKRKLVALSSISKVLDNLLSSSETGEYNICHASELLIIITPEIKNKKSLKQFGVYFKKLSMHTTKSTRVKMKIEDALNIGKIHKLL